MPRSFLVKTHSSHRIPNYGQLETQRGLEASCWSCGGIVVPFLLPGGDTLRPWDRAPVISRLPLPLLRSEEAQGALSPGDPAAPGAPLRDSLNRLALPGRRPAVQNSGGDKAPDRLCGAAGSPWSPGCSECCRCRRPYAPHCDPQPRRRFSCKRCAKEYGSLGALKLHLRTHTLPCVCALCGKAFSRPWLLQGHIRTHTGEKPYTCSHCGRAFADRSNLRAHLQTHSDVKRYQCKGCAKTFSRMSLLARHEESGCCPGP
ncbi:zinc finger protein SNAI3 [Orycteropus afer afer]|uniref:Zinc finger protein SNAI3 n=1 Tax=Orycteropus afer afer TaxID=1230840 RepID=A0A8B6ZNY5_ORYAF|nr:zinc finger protein SNAI3 [Orycteropus afer afer]